MNAARRVYFSLNDTFKMLVFLVTFNDSSGAIQSLIRCSYTFQPTFVASLYA